MNKKTIIYFVFALTLSLIGNLMHYTCCVHPRVNFFELSNFIAHSFIYGSLFLVLEIVKNKVIIKTIKKSDKEILSTAKSYCEGISEKQLKFMIIATKLFCRISDKRFIIVTNALISLLFGFLIYLFSGNWSMLYVSVVVSFFLTKYWVMSNWGSEMDEKKRELKIELMVFEESKKANLSNKKDL